MTESDLAVELRGVSKAFDATQALSNVDWDVRRGEIHALIGQNGAGKSTVVKLLSGYYAPDSGELLVGGSPLSDGYGPWDAADHGLGFFHQTMPMEPALTVLENIRVGRYGSRAAQRIRWKNEERVVESLLDAVGLRLDPNLPLYRLTAAERALVGLARAVGDVETSDKPGVLVLDEPTAVLPGPAVERLEAAMFRMVERGLTIILVSHRLDEILRVADRMSVLRDGRMVGTIDRADADEQTLVKMIVGSDLSDRYPHRTKSDGEPVLEVRNLSGGRVIDASFTVHRGEILGLTGLVGMGHDEVPYLVYGAERADSGEVVVGDTVVDPRRPRPDLARAAGIGFLPADRAKAAGIPAALVRENLTMPILGQFFVGGRLRRGLERTHATKVLHDMQVRPPDPSLTLSSLSGGNQQKVLLGKWFQLEPTVQFLHEPTQGIDVGARVEVFRAIRAAADRGTGIVLCSSEHEDLANTCDRVLVFRRGAIAAELSGDELTFERIVEQCFTTK